MPHRFSASHGDGLRSDGCGEQQETRIFRNDWTAMEPPEPGSWTPELSVSVVVAAVEGGRADLTLAALSVQTYPAHLLDVVVVAGPGAAPESAAPRRLRVVRTGAGTDPAGARALGARRSRGDVVCWLDAGMLVDPFFVEMLARWHHLHPECVTVADLLTARSAPEDSEDAALLAMSGAMADELGAEGACAHRDALLESTGDLALAGESGHAAFCASAAAVRRHLYEAVEDPDGRGLPDLGRRLWHAGGIFVPDRDAPAWFSPGTAPDPLDGPDGAAGSDGPDGAPLIRAVVDIDGAPYDLVRACVDRLLDSGNGDFEAVLVADWDRPGNGGQGPLELRLLQAAYLSDPRVRFEDRAPRTGFPSPFLLQLPVAWGLAGDTLDVLAERARRSRAGVVELVPESAPTCGAGVRLWRTRALLRALRVRRRGETLAEAVAEVHGRYRIRAGDGALTDLTEPAARLYRSDGLRSGRRPASAGSPGSAAPAEESAEGPRAHSAPVDGADPGAPQPEPEPGGADGGSTERPFGAAVFGGVGAAGRRAARAAAAAPGRLAARARRLRSAGAALRGRARRRGARGGGDGGEEPEAAVPLPGDGAPPVPAGRADGGAEEGATPESSGSSVPGGPLPVAVPD
ncbi:hypothetical protein GCM10027440_21670 [Nocardiopsis coralliicola]